MLCKFVYKCLFDFIRSAVPQMVSSCVLQAVLHIKR